MKYLSSLIFVIYANKALRFDKLDYRKYFEKWEELIHTDKKYFCLILRYFVNTKRW